MRLLLLLVLAATASAQDYEKAKAVCAEAREIRREKGYAAAIDFLEPRLDHPLVLRAYADCCLWGGEEERGLRGIRGAVLPDRDRAEAEIRLLVLLFRHREAAALAHEHGWKEAEDWWGAQAALRDRLRARAGRGAWLAAALALVLVGAWALMRRRFSSARGSA